MYRKLDTISSPRSPSCECRATCSLAPHADPSHRSFSLGAIVTSVLGLVILPRFSCTATAVVTVEACDVATENVGWRYMLGALAIIVRRQACPTRASLREGR